MSTKTEIQPRDMRAPATQDAVDYVDGPGAHKPRYTPAQEGEMAAWAEDQDRARRADTTITERLHCDLSDLLKTGIMTNEQIYAHMVHIKGWREDDTALALLWLINNWCVELVTEINGKRLPRPAYTRVV